jgi:two-component system response regulator MtrA
MSPHALVVEDDPSVRELATLVLRETGFKVDIAADAPAVNGVAWDSYQLVVLDIGLPSGDGLELCRRVRERSAVPIMMLTARDDSRDLVAGLDAGADDYVVKPFEPEVLAARARAAVRSRAPEQGDQKLCVGDLTIDERGHRVSVDDDEINLSSTELRLLAVLARHQGVVLNRMRLLEDVWGYDYLGDSRLVDMAVLRLRQKLRPTSSGVEITTIRGEGYRLDP